MTRSGMATLIDRLQALCTDASITDAVAQELLDARAYSFDVALTPRAPFYLDHDSGWENLESGSVTKVYYGTDTLLTETTDYTVDYQRGVVTTLAADRRGLRMQSVAYDVYGAAADAWERVAAASADAGESVSGLGYSISGAASGAGAQAARYRALAWPRTVAAERGDSVLNPRVGDWHNARHYKAGY